MLLGLMSGIMLLLRRLDGLAGFVFLGLRLRGDRLAASARILRHRTDNALGQEQRHRDEKAAERKEPETREQTGEDCFAAIDEDGADDRPDQRCPAADRR